MLKARPKLNRTGEPFGSWLLVRARDAGVVGELAALVAADRRFRADGDVHDLRALLNADGAPTELHDALDQAELDWLAF